MPRVSGLHIYPVKSLRGISVSSSVLEPRGLRHDRRWMLVDNDGVFMTQRRLPGMARIQVAVDESHLRLQAEGKGGVSVPITDEGPVVTVRVWQSVCDAVLCSPEAGAWLSEVLETPSRLVRMPDSTLRATNPKYSRDGDMVSFADGFPVLVVSQASLDALNALLFTPIPMDRFRPNIVLEGSEAYAEDTWEAIDFGDSSLRFAKPCGRCIMTTVDQHTGQIDGVEPLRTLAQYRLQENSANFAANYIPERLGVIRVGDEVKT